MNTRQEFLRLLWRKKTCTALVVKPLSLFYPTKRKKYLICPHCRRLYDMTDEVQVDSSYDDFHTIRVAMPFLKPPNCYEIVQHICGGVARIVPAKE